MNSARIHNAVQDVVRSTQHSVLRAKPYAQRAWDAVRHNKAITVVAVCTAINLVLSTKG